MEMEEGGGHGAGGATGGGDHVVAARAADGGEPPYLRGVGKGRGRVAERRRPFTFVLDPVLVERARREVGDQDMVRSIEAALAAAIDYQHWVREISKGGRSALR